MHVAKNWLMLNFTDYMSQISLWLGPRHQGAEMEDGNLTRDQLQTSPLGPVTSSLTVPHCPRRSHSRLWISS